ncbi:MAG: nucleotide exchange factor GrpE [Planctomycetes bacterium]|nr:nucleotide exchange factor GrpE [Planctomycetota bacterium]MCW8134624.1 nucleotide exchange factor GrpE [Planctomycetota bacterium]
MPDEHKQVIPESQPEETHEADKALHDAHDAATAQAARHGEQIAAQDVPLKQKAKQLRKLTDEELVALAEQAAKSDHWLDVARRAQAEMDNTIKRLRREQQDSAKFAAGSLARDLLPVIDNLARALEAAGKSQDFKSLHDGVQLIARMFTEALARHDVTPIEAQGQPFDPAYHEALMMDNRDDLPDNTVTTELERGWKMHDRVLRATKVRVNKRG